MPTLQGDGDCLPTAQGGSDATESEHQKSKNRTGGSVRRRPDPQFGQRRESSTSLDVSWKEPDNTGPAITGYDIRYREGNSGDVKLIPPAGTGTTATIAPTGNDQLTPGSSYEVYVRAQNGESPSQWSAAGIGRTSIGNSEPTFDDRDDVTRDGNGNLPAASTERTVAENTRAGQSVGTAVGAVDGNGDRRTYRLVAVSGSEPDVGKFDINESNGQILTKDPLNHEASDCDYEENDAPTTCTYTVMVQVWDGLDEDRDEQNTSSLDNNNDADDVAIIDDTITVNIMVRDVAEKPAAPAVTVTSPTDGGTTSLVVTWDAPDNTGPAITGYRLECTGHEVPDDQCPRDIAETDVTYTITGLTAEKSYRVRLRAKNDEGDGAWSSWVTQLTNEENNALPTFTSPPSDLYVVENAPSARQPLTLQDGTVTNIQTDATDGDSPLTLRLGGPGAGRFDIDASTGQIRTKSKLNYEDAECNPDGNSCSYSVRVKLSDPNGGSIFLPLTVNVTDSDEPPAKPAAPRVTATSGSGWSLQVTWNAPRNDGPPFTGYQIRYRKTGDSAATWRRWPPDGSIVTDRSAKITTIPDAQNTQVHLEPRTQYEVQVRALNGEGDPPTFDDNPNDNWSASGRGTTGASNRRPVFDSTLPVVVRLQVEENTRSGQNVGNAVEATDPDDNRLTFTLEGPGKDSFTITSAGQIRTRAALNYEERDEYSLTVKVNDGQRKNNSVAAKSVAIEVTDRAERPSAPRAPRVSGIPGSTDSVRVMWDAPANPGPAITHYSVQYAVAGSRDAFDRVTVPKGAADRSVVITGLTAGTRYEVQVRAESPENHSEWSLSGTGSPNPDAANRNPAFSNRSHTFNVAENTPSGADVGSLVAALDPDGDTLTYSLEGTDADSFDIIATNGAGQIQTKAALNYEEKASYSVAVRVTDGRGGTDAVNVTIRVTDVDNEAPDTPFAPTVAPVSSTDLQVTWEAPANTGPPITDYDYRYRAVTDPGWTEVTNTTIRGTTITVPGLTPSTSYDVEVRAKNAEGTSGWSNPGNGATNEPGANNRPVFPDGTSATRSVSATAPAGTSIGLPVAATDADSGDTLTYSLEGRDAGLFDINDTSGQLLTRSGVTLIAGETYTVTVAADDQTDITRITVSINATAAPPNNPPVFSEGASATRSVSAGAQAGTSIGLPVAATDADQGDTLTYSLEGQDAASFDINSANGQLLTLAGVTLDQSTYTVEVVASDGTASARITVTITVVLNNPPTFPSTTATRSVDENTAAGIDIGLPVSATDANAGDILTYRLSGADAASFNIVPTTGQIQTKAALDYETDFRYSVTITVSDGELTDSIRVTINIMDMHPSCASAIGNGANTGLANDCEALLDSRDTLEGTGATRPLNWATHTRIANWYGVVLSDTPRRVIQLRLHGQNANAERGTVEAKLKGSIPPELGRLSELEILYLHRNVLTGQIPGALNNLSKLQQLYLYDNELTAISGELGSGMAELRRLFAQRNRISGSIPANLGNMPRLDWLRLDRNRLTGAIPSQLGNLSTLRRLYLHEQEGWRTGGGFSGTIPSTFSRLSRLEYLVLNRNSLGGQIPSGLGSLSNLKWLGLYDNGFTGSIPAQLGSLSNLERLYLHGNGLTGSVPAQLGSLSSLTNLWLKNNSLSGPIPEQLSQLELNRLRLSGSGLTACVPEGLVPTRTLYKSDGTEIPPTDDIEEAGLTVCGSGN